MGSLENRLTKLEGGLASLGPCAVCGPEDWRDIEITWDSEAGETPEPETCPECGRSFASLVYTVRWGDSDEPA